MTKIEARIRRLETAQESGVAASQVRSRRIAAAQAILAYALGVPLDALSHVSNPHGQRMRSGAEILADLFPKGAQ